MPTNLRPLIKELETLQMEMERLAEENVEALEKIRPECRASATNLLHYLALRRHDIRELQEQLAALGLSSLGRTETHVLSALEIVLGVLKQLSSGKAGRDPGGSGACDRKEGRRLLERNTELLLGPEPEGRTVRIMVTMPSEAATDYQLVRDLLAGGMNCMRINCAHDGEAAWSGMIANLRRAENELGKTCRVEMDLAGPKLRTGPVEPGPAVIKIRPERDALGRVEKKARIWLTAAGKEVAAPAEAAATVRVPGGWLSSLGPGDEIRLTDARGARRTLAITRAEGKGRWAECGQTAYITSGMELKAVYKGGEKPSRKALAGEIPPAPGEILLRIGDTVRLTRSLAPGQPAGEGPARIGVTLPEFFGSVESGQPIWFDDGKIGGIVAQTGSDEVLVEITHARPQGEKLGAEKGINLPETDLRTDSLTAADLEALPFVAANADILGYSFVRTERDVRLLQSELAKLGATKVGIVLKIETRAGFDNLPSLLLAAMGHHIAGVMIARGDLAIECGFQRLAEAQEEILWISEAAHVPVIWATQVLESLTKTGTPSRSEITDAAMGERAECVMLNKGQYVVDAVRTLDDILRRMQAHQDKKSSMMRKLSVAAGFGTAGR